MKAYSLDLREKVVAAVDRGMSRAAVAIAFGVSPSTVKRWRRRRKTGSAAPRPIPGRPARLGAALDAGLEPHLRAAPDATIAEHCAAWEQATGQAVSPSTMRRAIDRLGWTRKKRA
jgi:transposase